MKISYNPLWKQLEIKKISKKEFRVLTKIGSSTYSKLVNNDNVTTDTLIRICNILNCKLQDLIECVEESDEKN